MPARNAERTIEESMRSVLSQAEVAELVVVDDGSTDRTAALAAGIGDGRVRVIPGPEQGISAALNAGVEAASHPYIARCDSDDLFVPGRFAVQLSWLIDHPEYIGISGGFQTITARGTIAADLASDGRSGEMTERLKQGQVHTSFCTWLLRKAAWEAIGGARAWFATAEDIDVQFRLAFYGRVWHGLGIVYRYRLHDQSITHQSSDVRREFYDEQACRFALQRLERGADDLEEGHPPSLPDCSGDVSPRGSARSQAAGQAIGAAWKHFDSGRRGVGIRLACNAVRIEPLSGRGWRGLVVMLVRSVARRK